MFRYGIVKGMKVGQVIGGYELRQRIASGGMGTIWKASHPTLERMVAVKLIRADVQNEPDVQEAFVREARNLSRLHSPHIVQVMDFGFTEKGIPYLVTEFLDGEDLRARLERIGPIPAQSVLPIAIDVLKAMTEAHAVGLVHRDLKPGNIFLQRLAGDAGEATKVLDFGVAKLTSGEGQENLLWPSGGAKGSPRYMAPEQVLGEPVTHAADIYSFGATLFRVLTGRPVFEGSTVEVLRAHIESPPPDLLSHVPRGSCPEDLADVVARCLQKAPGDRPSSASALQTRLERMLSRLTVDPSSTIPPRPTPSADMAPESEPVRIAQDSASPSMGLPEWFQPTSSVGPNPIEPDGLSHDEAPELTAVDLAVPLSLDRSDSSGAPPSDGPVTTLNEPPSEASSQPPLELAAVESSGPSVVEDEFRGTLDSETAASTDSTNFLSTHKIWVISGFGLVVFGIALWAMSESESPKTESRIERELSQTSAFLDRIESQQAAQDKEETVPSVVKQFERSGRRATIQLEVTPFPARFVSQKSGQVHCAQAKRCQVPVHEDILVKKKGYRALILSRDDLYDRRAGTWRIVLQRW